MNPISSLLTPFQPYIAGIKIVGYVLLVAAIFASGMAAGHKVSSWYYQPKIDKLTGENAKLNGETLEWASAYHVLTQKLADQNTAVSNLKADSDKRIAAGAAAVALATKTNASLQSKADWLAEQLAKPEPAGMGCEDALKEWKARP